MRTGLLLMVFLGVMLGISFPAVAQLNVIAGYDLSGLRNTQMNGIINDYNAADTKVELAFKQVKVLHGFVAGFRYGYDWGGLEITFSKRSTRRIGDYYNVHIKTDTVFDEKGEVEDLINISENANIDVNYDIKTISLTKEFGGNIRIGGSLDYNIYTYSVKYDPRDPGPSKLRKFKSHQTTWGSKLFIGAHLTNSTRMSFSVRAYYQWIWSANSLDNFETMFDKSKPDCTYCSERPHSIGISIIINNGLQP